MLVTLSELYSLLKVFEISPQSSLEQKLQPDIILI